MFAYYHQQLLTAFCTQRFNIRVIFPPPLFLASLRQEICALCVFFFLEDHGRGLRGSLRMTFQRVEVDTGSHDEQQSDRGHRGQSGQIGQGALRAHAPHEVKGKKTTKVTGKKANTSFVNAFSNRMTMTWLCGMIIDVIRPYKASLRDDVSKTL